jgi:hypothetical protein
VETVQDIRRVLRPTGTLIFFEHGLSPDARIRRWQQRTEPVTRWLFEGCHVTRDVPSLLEQNGFRIREMDAAYLSRFPKSWTYCWWARPFRYEPARPQRGGPRRASRTMAVPDPTSSTEEPRGRATRSRRCRTTSSKRLPHAALLGFDETGVAQDLEMLGGIGERKAGFSRERQRRRALALPGLFRYHRTV